MIRAMICIAMILVIFDVLMSRSPCVVEDHCDHERCAAAGVWDCSHKAPEIVVREDAFDTPNDVAAFLFDCAR
jgi:hypothetical protein